MNLCDNCVQRPMPPHTQISANCDRGNAYTGDGSDTTHNLIKYGAITWYAVVFFSSVFCPNVKFLPCFSYAFGHFLCVSFAWIHAGFLHSGLSGSQVYHNIPVCHFFLCHIVSKLILYIFIEVIKIRQKVKWCIVLLFFWCI